MRQSVSGMIDVILKARFSYLFFTIILFFLLRTFIAGAVAINLATNIFLWFIVIACVWAVHEKRRQQWFAMTMAAVAVATGLLDFLVPNALTSWTSKITIVLFLGYAVVTILIYLARQEEVTADMIMAGASEYMLIGVLWAFLYMLVEAEYPGSFSFAGQKDRSGFIYYSFVTLTTTGYGDLLPVSDQARSLAILETITGQLFIAITVARLVGLYTAKGNKN
ncbi:MAG: Ion channel [Syntrophus sp. PtaB.Bin001]|nr:MAG: Ion channel [Syntrophus sp. PtaB.Bin001]